VSHFNLFVVFASISSLFTETLNQIFCTLLKAPMHDHMQNVALFVAVEICLSSRYLAMDNAHMPCNSVNFWHTSFVGQDCLIIILSVKCLEFDY
jgi:hypothetical protein